MFPISVFRIADNDQSIFAFSRIGRVSINIKALVISAMIEVGIISFMINAPLSKGKGYRDVAKQGKETEV